MTYKVRIRKAVYEKPTLILLLNILLIHPGKEVAVMANLSLTYTKIIGIQNAFSKDVYKRILAENKVSALTTSACTMFKLVAF